MTSGNNGASTPPEDDDPFGYLYADGQANGAQPPSSGYGYPNAMNRTRPVGQRQYGQQTAPQVPPQQGTYGQPNAHYAAPETFPGSAPTTQQQLPSYGGGNGRGRGPNTKGLLIGAIAVVAAVVIGIAVAMAGGDDGDKGGGNQADSTPTQGESKDSSPSASSSAGEKAELPKSDAKSLRLSPGVGLASDVTGANSGSYVTGLNQSGASVTWSVDGIPEEGVYTLFTRYSVPGKDQSMTLTVNGKVFGSKMNLSNFAKAGEGDYAKAWTETYVWPTLNKGTNTIVISCGNGDKCDVLLDQLWLKAGQVKN
ncbi:carbohydrate-binding protein [Streptomyces sp. NBC_00287]|uniref:carbohydrate-binding protein n=1 Tax=Streptomyces sp. NBC_00287 TaxID=2975702 RepID=UPI002E2B10C2|nr:carbohydrate-binding protein [Streptomyces sp. NBC_00287]